MNPELQTALIQYLVVPIAGAVGLLIATALGFLVKKLNAGAEKDKAEGKSYAVAMAAAKLANFARAAVMHVEAELKPELVAASADGTITAEEGAALKKHALDALKAFAGKEGLAEIGAVLGLAGPVLEQYLSGLIETAVAFIPKPGTAAAQVP